MSRLIMLLFFVLPSQILSAQSLDIPDFSATYLVRLNGLQAGELNRSLVSSPDGSRLFKSETQAKGIFAFFKPEKIVETSLWQLNNQKIRPQKYSYVRRGGKKDKAMYLDFDWAAHRLHINDTKHPWSLDLSPQTLDKLVYQLALMSDLASNKSQFSYQIADGGKLKTYNISILGQEMVTTPLGKISAIKLLRKRDRPKDRKTTLWCAPELNFLPVQLEHIEKNGTVFTATLQRLKGINTETAFKAVTLASP